MQEGRQYIPAGPMQYGTGDRCDKCKGWLSRYNPHTVCEACRRRMAGEAQAPRFPRRKPLGRGALLAETEDCLPAEFPEPESERQVPIDPIPAEDAPQRT
jgi:hypothetical protein